MVTPSNLNLVTAKSEKEKVRWLARNTRDEQKRGGERIGIGVVAEDQPEGVQELQQLQPTTVRVSRPPIELPSFANLAVSTGLELDNLAGFC
jgi:hypothetical protein